jgi:single-strand DNA-binding protein
MQLNNVQLVGRLTKDPELKNTTLGKALVEASLAINESYTDSDGQKHDITTFCDFQTWGKSAEALAKRAQKGEQLFVSGPLRQSNWKDQETGKDRSKLFVKADSWQFVQYKATEARREAAKAVEVESDEEKWH